MTMSVRNDRRERCILSTTPARGRLPRPGGLPEQAGAPTVWNMSARRHGLTIAGALTLCVALAGCSGQSMQYGKLAQASGTAASAAQSAAYTLALHRLRDLTGPVTDTGLSDSMTNLQQAADSLTSMTLTGAPRAARDDVLKQVRDAQDAVLRAQATLQSDSSSAAGKARRALERAAQALSHRESDLKAKK